MTEQDFTTIEYRRMSLCGRIHKPAKITLTSSVVM